MIKREDIRIRDPFILTDTENGCYYMYGTTDLLPSTLGTGRTFSVYKTTDLENFSEPITVFDGASIGFWATDDYWAPEVHKYNGRYYMFASFNAKGAHRATCILVCDRPDGMFCPIGENPATPVGWGCLDGTLLIENGVPYIVFCHEWTSVGDGEIWAMELCNDLSAPAGEPFMLFKASDNPEVTELEAGSGNYVTDGPFLYRENGRLNMIWSSFCQGKYSVLTACSDSIRGRWEHKGNMFGFDGGHAMIFSDLAGVRRISMHSPNTANDERAVFYKF